jgi:hypothetical protein
MKKKANDKFCARLNAGGYEHIDGIHFDKDTKSSAGWNANIVDVNGAFLWQVQRLTQDVC